MELAARFIHRFWHKPVFEYSFYMDTMILIEKNEYAQPSQAERTPQTIRMCLC